MTDRLAGHEVVWVTDGRIEVAVATGLGPRILGLRLHGGPNIFAELGSAGIDVPGSERFTFYGGHRLWVAPEVPEVTYQPDDAPVVAERDRLRTSLHRDVGPFAKTIAVTFENNEARVDHVLSNRTNDSAEVAAWGITQLRPGGTARLPLATTPGDAHGLQPNRMIVAWPYTDWADPLIEIDRTEVRVLPGRTQPTKVGTVLGAAGALHYDIDGLRFSKRISSVQRSMYTDLGANGQVYANDQFVELETVGPLVTLAPGESTTHSEWWSLSDA